MSNDTAKDSHTLLVPLVCNPLAIDNEVRPAHEERARALFQHAILERQELPDGLAFRVKATDYDLITAFIAQERLCCPFFHFALEIAPNQGDIWLRITGIEGVKAVLVAGLDQILIKNGKTR